MNGIAKEYKVKHNNELLEVQIPPSSLYSLYLFFLKNLKMFFYFESHGKITAGLRTEGLILTSNWNFKVRLQKYSLFLHRDLQMLHFPFTIFFLGSTVIYYSIINSLISPDLINLNFN